MVYLGRNDLIRLLSVPNKDKNNYLLKLILAKDDDSDATSSSSTIASASSPESSPEKKLKSLHTEGSKTADTLDVEYAVDEAIRKTETKGERQWLKKRNKAL